MGEDRRHITTTYAHTLLSTEARLRRLNVAELYREMKQRGRVELHGGYSLRPEGEGYRLELFRDEPSEHGED